MENNKYKNVGISKKEYFSVELFLIGRNCDLKK
jgi:hypothetical protein